MAVGLIHIRVRTYCLCEVPLHVLPAKNALDRLFVTRVNIGKYEILLEAQLFAGLFSLACVASLADSESCSLARFPSVPGIDPFGLVRHLAQ
jgi:hypothetical protein